MVFKSSPFSRLCMVMVLSASFVIIKCFPSLENSMPSVSGPPTISRTFLPSVKSTTATRAGSLTSLSSSSSFTISPGFGGGPPLELGSKEINALSPRIRTNSGFLPTSMCCINFPVALSTTEILPLSLLAVIRSLPSAVTPMPRGPFAWISMLPVVSMVLRSITVTPPS